MSCFGGLSQVLSNIGQVLRLHCGTIVCAPGGSAQEAAEQLPLAGHGSVQEAGDDSVAAVAAAKGTLSCCWLAALLLMALSDAVHVAGWFHCCACWLAERLDSSWLPCLLLFASSAGRVVSRETAAAAAAKGLLSCLSAGRLTITLLHVVHAASGLPAMRVVLLLLRVPVLLLAYQLPHGS